MSENRRGDFWTHTVGGGTHNRCLS